MTEIQTTEILNALLEKSLDKAVILFKHSNSCGTSAFALEQLEVFLSEYPEWNSRCGIIVVQTHREISNHVADLFAVTHQSPQIFIIHKKQVVWHKSHHSITSEAVKKNVFSAPQQVENK